jgi:hypothetical protein
LAQLRPEFGPNSQLGQIWPATIRIGVFKLLGIYDLPEF